ncbi:hypothetical protein PRIPAC_71851, partial [Pristionchus pacificus]|uniref:Uncharacterized protein n=1 Tax=Pristionchus pacificus TaxID=54126 RepID=A0A2A6C1X8_PRIPA
MARGVVGWRFSLLAAALVVQPLLGERTAGAAEDCTTDTSDRLLFYTIKPDCSIRVATGAIPSAQFKPTTVAQCADAKDVRHGTFTSDAKPGILAMYRNPPPSVRDPTTTTPRWIVHLIAIAASHSSAFSMDIGDEDYFLEESGENDACGVEREKSLVCVSASADHTSLRLTRYEQRGQNYTRVAATTASIRHGVLAADTTILSLTEAGNGTIRVRAWSERERKLTLITISPDLVIQSIVKQLLKKEIGSVIAADDDTILARNCDERGCRTLMRGKRTHAKEEEEANNDPTKLSVTGRMFAEKFEVYETILDFAQAEGNPGVISGIQAIVVFLYLLVYTLVMFIRTVEDDGESLRFTTTERAQLHGFDYIQQQEDAKKEKTKYCIETAEEKEETAEAPAPVRQESSAPPSESGDRQKGTVTASSGPATPGPATPGPSRSTTTITTQQPTTRPSQSTTVVAASSVESMTKPTEDNFVHDEDAVAAGVKKKPEQHSLTSMEAMVEGPPPPPPPRKLMQTETSGVSPDLTTASRTEPQQPPPPPPAVVVPAPLQKSRSNLKPVPDSKPPSRRFSPTEPHQQKRTADVMKKLPPTPPPCQHHYVSPGGFSTCTALCSQVADFNRQYAMGLGRSATPLVTDSKSDRGYC